MIYISSWSTNQTKWKFDEILIVILITSYDSFYRHGPWSNVILIIFWLGLKCIWGDLLNFLIWPSAVGDHHLDGSLPCRPGNLKLSLKPTGHKNYINLTVGQIGVIQMTLQPRELGGGDIVSILRSRIQVLKELLNTETESEQAGLSRATLKISSEFPSKLFNILRPSFMGGRLHLHQF